MSDKPIHAKAGLYAMYYEYLKEIAKDYGYNLVPHGSFNRDLDLIAIPWIDNPRPEHEMILEFQEYLTGIKTTDHKGNAIYSILPGNRHCYVINLNRGNKHGEWVRFEDKQYYLDISVVQISKPKLDIFDFKKKRLQVNMTLRQVEQKTGFSNAYLSQLENGKIKSPSFNVVKSLSDLYNSL